MSKQDTVVRMVKEGVYTRQEILEEANCTPGALASYLSAMRNAAKYTGQPICPIEITEDDGNKVFSTASFEEVEEAKAERAANRPAAGPPKTPEERLAAAEKKVARCDKANSSVLLKLDKDQDNEILNLKSQVCSLQLRIADIELAEAQSAADMAENSEVAEEASEEELL